MEHFWLRMVNCNPLSPSVMLKTTNTACRSVSTLIDDRERGKEEMKVTVSLLILKKYKLVGDRENICALFSQKATSKDFFSKIVA